MRKKFFQAVIFLTGINVIVANAEVDKNCTNPGPYENCMGACSSSNDPSCQQQCWDENCSG